MPQLGTGRVVQIRTIVIPSIPLLETRQRFLTDLRYKASRISGRRLTSSTAEKYRHWLNRFERWVVENDLPLDMGEFTPEHMRQLERDVLDEIDEGTLQESSAHTYTRCIKTLFTETWEQLDLDPATNPAVRLHAGSQQAVDFPLFTEEHVRALLKAAVRPRGDHISPWMPYRDQALLATLFDLGWRVGEASQAQLGDVDFRTGTVRIPREHSKTRQRGRSVGLNTETARLLKTWVERWRPDVMNDYLFVSDKGGRFLPDAIRHLFRRLRKVADIPKEAARVSPHTCRHYFAVQWARKHPGDLAGLQRAMGHSSIQTTQIYFARADELDTVTRQQAMEPNWR